MRLMLCCLTIGSQSPDFLVFDELINTMNIQNIEILNAALDDYLTSIFDGKNCWEMLFR